MNNFEIVNEMDFLINEEKIRSVLNYTLKKENVENAIFNVIFVDNDFIKQLNKEYRNIDRVTDVISFALEDVDDFKTDFRILGDIYICYDKAVLQASEYEHSLDREICFLSVHGLLHLLGYDHMVIEDEKIMFDKQKEIMDSNELYR